MQTFCIKYSLPKTGYFYHSVKAPSQAIAIKLLQAQIPSAKVHQFMPLSFLSKCN